jgi:nucleotide-binding universal stress UspA family protein
MQADVVMNTSTPSIPVEEGRHRPAKRFGKAKWDKQPTQSSAVLIATLGVSIPPAVIRQAVQLSEGRPVAVVTIARIYGSSFGLPSPGLMPTRKEMDEQRAIVNKAIDRLERSGVEAWGQVASTRRYGKTIAQAAQARGVDRVLVVSAGAARWRRFLEGDTARDVRRRVGKQMAVESIIV